MASETVVDSDDDDDGGGGAWGPTNCVTMHHAEDVLYASGFQKVLQTHAAKMFLIVKRDGSLGDLQLLAAARAMDRSNIAVRQLDYRTVVGRNARGELEYTALKVPTPRTCEYLQQVGRHWEAVVATTVFEKAHAAIHVYGDSSLDLLPTIFGFFGLPAQHALPNAVRRQLAAAFRDRSAAAAAAPARDAKRAREDVAPSDLTCGADG